MSGQEAFDRFFGEFSKSYKVGYWELAAAWNEAIEYAYLTARGGQLDDRFQMRGTRQIYWKGRSDAATEIRSGKVS